MYVYLTRFIFTNWLNHVAYRVGAFQCHCVSLFRSPSVRWTPLSGACERDTVCHGQACHTDVRVYHICDILEKSQYERLADRPWSRYLDANVSGTG